MIEFDRDVVIHVLKDTAGNISASATKLGVSTTALRNFLSEDEELAGIYMPVSSKEDLSTGEEIKRDAPDGVTGYTESNSLVEAESDKTPEKTASSLDQISQDLIKAGHDPAILNKIDSINGFEDNAGKFLAGSMNLMYKMVVDSGVSLYEHLEFIKSKLNDPNLKDKDRIFWQRAYNTTVDQLGKSYDRVLQGTQVLAKMMPGDEDEKNKKSQKKPSFTPLKQ